MDRTASGAPGRARCRCSSGRQEFFRLGLEALAAARTAEEIILALVRETVLCGRRIDLHAADRIDREGCFGAVTMAGAGRVHAVCVIPIHKTLPGHLIHIPHGGIWIICATR